MTNNTVFLGGLVVLVLGDLIRFAAQRFADSNSFVRDKRFPIYLIISEFVDSIVKVMNWHAEIFIAESQNVHEIGIPQAFKIKYQRLS